MPLLGRGFESYRLVQVYAVQSLACSWCHCMPSGLASIAEQVIASFACIVPLDNVCANVKCLIYAAAKCQGLLSGHSKLRDIAAEACLY